MLLPVLGVEAAPSSASYGKLTVQGTGVPKAERAEHAGNPLPGVGAFRAETYFIHNIYISIFALLEL